LWVIVGFVGIVLAVEFTGRVGDRSAAGAATGGARGCTAGLETVSTDEIATGEVITVDEGVGAVPTEEAEVVTGEIVVRALSQEDGAFFDDGGTVRSRVDALDEALQRLALSSRSLRAGVEKPVEGHPLDSIVELSVNGVIDEAIAAFEGLPDVLYAEPVFHVGASSVPNDTYFGYQWHLSTLGLSTAWDTVDGTGVIVAVVDTGVSGGGFDGFGELLPGYDFVDNDEDASDENGHGTHVAGTIAQATNNGVGAAGTAPGASILPVRVLDANGSGTSIGVAQGIYWAVDNGADIINLSLGMNGYSAIIDEACAYAAENGVLVVAAAGNDGFSAYVSYPAALGSTLGVGATDLNGVVTYYSNRGEEVDISAPGGDLSVDADGDGLVDGVIQETVISGAFAYYLFSGTSMAAPHVAGVAALLHANGLTDRADLIDALTSSADDQGDAGHDTSYGYGIVDPVAALDYKASEPPALEIHDLNAVAFSPRRGVIAFETSLPAQSVITIETPRGDVEKSQPGDRSSHHYFVRGSPGSTVAVTVSAADGSGTEVQASIELIFAD
jgi:serine protease